MAEKSARLAATGEMVRTRLRELRSGRGMTQLTLAERTAARGREIPLLRIQRIESGQSRIDVDDLVTLAAAIGVSPALLMSAPEVNVDCSPVDIVVMVDSPDHEYYRHPSRIARNFDLQ